MRIVFFCASLAALTACSPGSNGAVLGVSVAPLQTQTTTNTTNNATTSTTDLSVTRIRILVNRAKLRESGSGKCGGPGAEAGPFVVDLAQSEIASGTTRDFTLNVSPGSYSDAEIEIEPLMLDKDGDSASPATTAELADFKSSGASILVDGTYKGNSFTYAAHFKAEQGQEGSSTTSTGAVVIPMKVDPSTWFVDANGSVMDPTDSNQHQAIAMAICHQLDTETDSAATSSSSSSSSGGGPGPTDHRGGAPHCVEP